MPAVDGKVSLTGKLGGTVSVEQGQQAAQRCFINVLAHLKAAANGDLDRVRRVVRLGGFIACAPDFSDQARVMNGASDLAVAVFGKPAVTPEPPSVSPPCRWMPRLKSRGCSSCSERGRLMTIDGSTFAGCCSCVWHLGLTCHA